MLVGHQAGPYDMQMFIPIFIFKISDINFLFEVPAFP